MKSNIRLVPILVGGGVVLIIALMVIVALVLRQPEAVVTEPDVPLGGGRGTVITEDNLDELREEATTPVEDGYFMTDMTMEWEFPNGSTEPAINAYAGNAERNTRTVYFDVTLADTGELVYSSPFIPVGEKVERFALTSELEPGTYNGVVTYRMVDDDNVEIPGGTVSVSVTLLIG